MVSKQRVPLKQAQRKWSPHISCYANYKLYNNNSAHCCVWQELLHTELAYWIYQSVDLSLLYWLWERSLLLTQTVKVHRLNCPLSHTYIYIIKDVCLNSCPPECISPDRTGSIYGSGKGGKRKSIKRTYQYCDRNPAVQQRLWKRRRRHWWSWVT